MVEERARGAKEPGRSVDGGSRVRREFEECLRSRRLGERGVVQYRRNDKYWRWWLRVEVVNSSQRTRETSRRGPPVVEAGDRAADAEGDTASPPLWLPR